MESRLEEIFSMGINCMSLAVWLVEDRKCSAAVVGLDLVLGLSMLRRCSLKRSFKRRLVSPMWRCGGLMVSALDSGASAPGSIPGRGHCVVFLGKTLHSHGASLHPGV